MYPKAGRNMERMKERTIRLSVETWERIDRLAGSIGADTLDTDKRDTRGRPPSPTASIVRMAVERGLSVLDSGAGIDAPMSESTADVAGRIEAAAARIEAVAAELMRDRGRNKASRGWVQVAHMGLDVALGSLRSARLALQPVGSNSPDVGGALKSIDAALSELTPYLSTPEAHIDPPPIPAAAEHRRKERRADPNRPDKSPGRRESEKPKP